MSTHAKVHTAGFYIKIWVALLIMLGVSIAIADIGHPIIATTMIFGIAIIKAILVTFFYMGLALEARYIPWIVISGLVVVIILFFGLMPDIVYIYGK